MQHRLRRKGDRIANMDKQDIYIYLKEKGIWHEVTEHKAVRNMADISEIYIPYPQANAKNLFIRDDKKRNYYLITVRGDKRVDLKELRHRYGTRPLSFASEEELMAVMGLKPGAVTPFGILNDRQLQVQVLMDSDFLEPPGLIGVHPNDNTATVWMRTEDLADIIKGHGNQVEIFDVSVS